MKHKRLRATLYRLAFSVARAAVIGNDEPTLQRHDKERPGMPGLGGGGNGSPAVRRAWWRAYDEPADGERPVHR